MTRQPSPSPDHQQPPMWLPVGDTEDGPAAMAGGGGDLAHRELFDLRFIDAPSLEPVLNAVLADGEAVDPEHLPVLVTPNVDIVVHLSRAEGSAESTLFRQARYVLPDGMPIVVASRLLRNPLSARLTGSGLFELLWPALVAENRSVVALVANSSIAERLRVGAAAARFLVAPFFDVADLAAIDLIVDQVLAIARTDVPEYVLLGVGHPKDPIVASRLLERWPAGLGRPPLCCCLGGSFAMYTGLKRRAPSWIQRAGFEWFYRFLQEPRRLFRRYFIRDLAFVGIVGRAVMDRRRAAGRGW